MTKFECWVGAWIDLAVGLCGILSLGSYRPWWDFTYRAYIALKHLKAKNNASTA